MLNIVLFGPPGAGKGTQSQKIINHYNLKHLSTGDLLRNAIHKQTPMGVEAQKYIDRGELVPDNLAIAIIVPKIEEFRYQTNGFVFDGFPRTTFQAIEFDKILAGMGTSVTIMVGLEVDYNELISRLDSRSKSSGRPDDQHIEIIKNRINIYNQTTAPVMEYYKAQRKYYGIDGVGTLDEIFNRICNAINQIVGK